MTNLHKSYVARLNLADADPGLKSDTTDCTNYGPGKNLLGHRDTSTPLGVSFKNMFFAYHHALNHLHTNIFLSIFSTNFLLNCAQKKIEN